jgi:S1-C subfamily serine protease
MTRLKRFTGVLIGFLLGGLLCGVAFQVGGERPQTIYAREARADLDPSERRVVEVFQRVSPGVVNVSNLVQRRSYFDLDVMEIPQGSGTGFVWDKKGHVVTNFHVILNASAITVTFADQTTCRAEVVGTYPDKDLAVLQINLPADKLTPMELGSSHDLLVGQTVLAIGNPFGLDHTLTKGVVSALGREIKSLTGRPIQDVIQTDAAINPGNSGGPLLDSAGRMVGVDTAIYSPSGSSAGIGFAVPVDTVRSVVTQLIEHGRVVRPGLGIQLFRDAVAGRLSSRLNIEGAIIAAVERRSAAARAGLRGTEKTDEGDLILGDVLTAIDGKKIRSADDIYKVLDRYKIGDEVELTYLRNKSELKTKLKLQSMSD